MKILVIDDTQNHLDAAKQTLSGHDITLCSSHDGALKLLEKQHNEEECSRLIEKYKNEKLENAVRKAYQETELPYWDAVLCDLLMPAGRNQQRECMKYVGQEMSVGWSLALEAARQGAKYVAVVTDMSHHDHPASAMLDSLSRHVFAIDGARMLMTNSVGSVGIIGSECTCKECGGTGKLKRRDDSEYDCFCCTKGIAFSKEGKDWGKILNQLMNADTAGK